MKDIYVLYVDPIDSSSEAMPRYGYELLRLQKLHRGGGVFSIGVYKRLTPSKRNKSAFAKIFKDICRCAIHFMQAVKAFRLSKKDDVIICREKISSLFVNMLSVLFRSKRQIIAYQWLSPWISPESKILYPLEKLAAKNRNFVIVMNSPTLSKEWHDYFGNMHVKAGSILIPDGYGYDSKFQPLLPKKGKYIFCGGFSNRDWPMIMKIAHLMPEVKFWCAALKGDFDRQMEGAEIPPNVHMHYNIPADEYYQKMHDAYAVVIALRDERVSGLINIIRSAVEGVLCIINRTDATNQYYTDENRDLLIDTREPEQWADKIREVLNFSDEEYIRRAEIFQNYIRDNFSPSEAAKKIYSLIQE